MRNEIMGAPPEKKTLTGAEYILEKIVQLGIKNIFGIPGAHIDPLLIAASESDIETVINTQELAAGYMADGYSRASKKLGVVTIIGGPGANNLVTAVNTARIEKVPLLIISGDVPVSLANVPGFQCGNQYGTNDDAIFRAITKYSKRVTSVDELVTSLDKAVNIALTPPFGPVHLIVPYNVFNETTTKAPQPVDYNKLKYQKTEVSDVTVNRIKKLLFSDKKLIFWIGNSLNNCADAVFIKALAEKFHIPVATSFSAKGIIDEDHRLSIGNFGYAGSSFSKNLFLSDEPDVIIGFDIEQNERNSLNWNPLLYKDKKLILINFPGSFSGPNYGDTLEDNPFYVLKKLYELTTNEDYDTAERKSWFAHVSNQYNHQSREIPPSVNGTIEPGKLIQILKSEMPKEMILFVDSGNHRLFAGFYWKSPHPGKYYSASVIAPLGWALAAGIGGKFYRNEPVVIFTGDGCMQMHGIELKTAIKHKKPVLVVITNNSAFGSIYKRFSKISETAANMASITEIDWSMFAHSFGAEVFDIFDEKDFAMQVRNFKKSKKLTILNVRTPADPFIHDVSLAKSAFA